MLIAICNQKGGTGKSTIAVHLAVCFATVGKCTLLVVGKAAQEEIHKLRYSVFDTILHTHVAYQEAMAAGMSVLEYASDSKAAQETRALFDEVREAIT